MKTRLFWVMVIVMQLGVCAWADSNEVEYYAALMDGAKVGHAVHSRIEADGQVKTTEESEMTMSRMGAAITVKTIEASVETTKGEPVSFAAEQDMGMGMGMKTEGTVGNDGTVKVRATVMGQVQENSFAWPAGAMMAEAVRLFALEKGLKEGTSYYLKIFSPSLMSAVDSRVQIGAKQEVDLLGRVVTLTKVDTAMSMPGMGEMVITSFVDDKFTALKTVMPMMGINVELVACSKKFALADNEYFDIGDKMFVSSPEPLGDVSSAKAIAYELKPVEGAGELKIPSGDNQLVRQQNDGTVLVVVEPVKMPEGAKYPYKGTDKEIMEATRPSRYLQSDDAKIIELAKEATKGARDAGEAARRIEAFVADYVNEMSLSVGYASATEVAASRKGDCSEFAVLCAAMCRAAGIPARVVVGVAYVEDFAGRSGFGGHAWTEAYIGGKWVGLDSAFKAGGRGGFDAGHIALASGDGEPADFFNMATTLGRFKIEKVTVAR